MRKQFLIVLIAFTAALAGFTASVYLSKSQNLSPQPVELAAQNPDELRPSDQRPEFSLPDIQGQTRLLQEWNGKVILINFWATWCPPCIKEMPALIALQDSLNDRGFQILGISDEPLDRVQAFAEKMQVNYPMLLNDPRNQLAMQYGNNQGVLPYSALINRDGEIVATYRGLIPFAQLQKDIQDSL